MKRKLFTVHFREKVDFCNNSPKYCSQLYGKKSTLTFTANLKNKKNNQLTLVSNLGICSTLYQVYGIVGV